jgi:hypothetical protein
MRPALLETKKAAGAPAAFLSRTRELKGVQEGWSCLVVRGDIDKASSPASL